MEYITQTFSNLLQHKKEKHEKKKIVTKVDNQYVEGRKWKKTLGTVVHASQTDMLH